MQKLSCRFRRSGFPADVTRVVICNTSVEAFRLKVFHFVVLKQPHRGGQRLEGHIVFIFYLTKRHKTFGTTCDNIFRVGFGNSFRQMFMVPLRLIHSPGQKRRPATTCAKAAKDIKIAFELFGQIDSLQGRFFAGENITAEIEKIFRFFQPFFVDEPGKFPFAFLV